MIGLRPSQSAGVDLANVSLDRGEMSFGLFNFDSSFEELIATAEDPLSKPKGLQHGIGEKALPDYLNRYVQQTSPESRQIAIHSPTSIEGYRDAEGLDKDKIERRRGFFGKSQREKFPHAIHHFAIFHNGKGKGRIIYKFEGNIQFIKNLRNIRPAEAA
jgi:hypothetical protein